MYSSDNTALRSTFPLSMQDLLFCSACISLYDKVVVVVVVYFILSRLLNLAFSANLGLRCMPHPGMGPLG